MPSSLLKEASVPASMTERLWRVGKFVLPAPGCIALGVFLVRGLADPSFIHELAVTNPTDYSIEVRVSGGDDSWLDLGAVSSGEDQVFHDVIGQGGTWILEFSYAGTIAGRMETEGAALAEGGWRVEVPARVGRALADEGFTSSPPGS